MIEIDTQCREWKATCANCNFQYWVCDCQYSRETVLGTLKMEGWEEKQGEVYCSPYCQKDKNG